ASGGEVLHTGVFQRTKYRPVDLGFVSDADASVPANGDDGGLRHGCAGDRGCDPKMRPQLVEEVRLVLFTAVDGHSVTLRSTGLRPDMPERARHCCILGSCVGSAYMPGQS